MTPLPLDVARCHPIHADLWCKQCRRYADHPDQTWGPRTPAWNCYGSEDNACAFIPIKPAQPDRINYDTL